MSDDARTNALQNPQVAAGAAWSSQSKTQFGRINAFDGTVMLQMLGTWWRRWFGDMEQLDALYDGTGQVEYESYLTFLDTVACLSRFDVPVFKTRNWYYLTLLESEMATTSKILYGTAGLNYSKRSVPAYGYSGKIDGYKFTLPEDVVAVPSMMNRVIDPSLVLLNERDYEVSDGTVVFNSNPFENALIPSREIHDSAGNVVDRQIALWMHLSEWDLEYVYRHFGYVLGIWMQSSTFYKDLLNALWDNMVLGSEKAAFEMALEAMTGVRFAEGSEVVTFIEEDGSVKHVITDKNIYTFSSKSEVVVQEGDELRAGQQLVDTVQIVEPSHLSNWNAVMGISLGEAFLTGHYRAPLVFQNRSVPVEYIGIMPDGKARVEFSVSGNPADVREFWHNVHLNGFLAGKNLSEYLDTRGNKSNPVPPWSLPKTINPFQFAIDNLLKNNTYAVMLKPEAFISGSVGIGAMAHLSRHLPPHTTFLTFICTDVVNETIDLEAAAEDTVAIGSHGVFNRDTFNRVTDRGPRIRTIPENCR